MANTVAYGFYDLQDVFSTRVRDLSVPVISDAIEQSVMQYNQEWMGMMQFLVEETTKFQESYREPAAGTLQPLSETGVPVPRQSKDKYDVAYPLQRGGDAWGTTREARAKMTVQQLNENVMETMRLDYDWMIRHTLAALFTNTTWTYDDDDDNVGTLTIQPLANDDTVTYPLSGLDPATDTHYLADANAIDDSNNHYETMHEELDEHPSNSGPYISWIPTNLVATTKALADFVEIKKIWVDYGDSADTANEAVRQYIGFGNEVLGVVGDVIVVRARRMPASYILTVASGAEGPPIDMREHEEAELKGLQGIVYQENTNFERVDYYRIAGFGAKRRVSACVMRVGNGTYAIPSGFSAPLAV